MCLARAGMWRVRPDGDSCVSRVFRGWGLLARHSRGILFCQPVQFDIHFLCLHYLYPYYPQMWGELLRENPSQTTWELENVYTYNSLHICFGNFLISYLSIFIPLRGWYPKHLPHSLRVSSEVLVLLGSIGRSLEWQMQHRACYGIQRTRQDTVPRSLVGVGAWRA